jgi:ribonuclease P protein component
VVRKAPEGFPWHYRIVRGPDFRALYDTGLKLHSERFVLFARQNSLGHHRLGLTVSRKIGGAVVRNRVKRLFREIFRKSTADIPPALDLVINAKRGSGSASLQELREEYESALSKVSRRMDAPVPQ